MSCQHTTLINDSTCENCGLVVSLEYVDEQVDDFITTPIINSKNPQKINSETVYAYDDEDDTYHPEYAAIFPLISELSCRLHLPQCIEKRAIMYFKRAMNALKGNEEWLKAAICVYIACRREKVPRTYRELCDVTPFLTHRDGPKVMRRLYVKVTNSLGLYLPPDDGQGYVNRFGMGLGLDRETCLRAGNILVAVKELDAVAGRCPISLAATCVYLSAAGKITVRDIADISGLSPSTILTVHALVEKAVETLSKEDMLDLCTNT